MAWAMEEMDDSANVIGPNHSATRRDENIEQQLEISSFLHHRPMGFPWI